MCWPLARADGKYRTQPRWGWNESWVRNQALAPLRSSSDNTEWLSCFTVFDFHQRHSNKPSAIPPSMATTHKRIYVLYGQCLLLIWSIDAIKPSVGSAYITEWAKTSNNEPQELFMEIRLDRTMLHTEGVNPNEGLSWNEEFLMYAWERANRRQPADNASFQ